MEELQLALTATRVEQKNFGLWLKSWQVGQVLQALVTDKSPSGNLVLRVGGHQITATADIPVQKGAVLTLEVSGLQPVPTLKIVSSPVQGGLFDALAGQLQLLMPKQSSVAQPFVALLDPIQGAKILSLLGVQSDALAQLHRSLNRFEAFVDPKQLQQALQQSGFFLESQLRQLVLSGGVLPEGDIKAELLKLLDKISRKTGRVSDEEADSEESEVLDALLLLQREIEGGVATIALNQIATCQHRDEGRHVWLFEVPFRYQEVVETLTLEIERDSDSAQEPPENQDWRVVLSLELAHLGQLEAELFLRGSKVSIVIYAERQSTLHVLESQIDQLHAGLGGRGLDVSILRCHHGARQQGKMAVVRQCLDERV